MTRDRGQEIKPGDVAIVAHGYTFSHLLLLRWTPDGTIGEGRVLFAGRNGHGTFDASMLLAGGDWSPGAISKLRTYGLVTRTHELLRLALR